jgi:lipopolysaccharide transport system permease protein
MKSLSFPLFQSKDLLLAWTNRTIRGRYQQSFLGWLWAIVQPVASVVIFSIIFTRFVPVNTGSIPYPVFSYIAVAPWSFLAASLQDMTISLVQNISLVTKVYFPREVLPVSAMLARLLDFAVAIIVLVALLIIYKIPVYLPGLIYLPLILLLQIILILGIGLITASLNVFYRDVQPLLALVIQLWFYASPIIYPVTLVPEQFRFLYYLNPMAGILEAYRGVLLYQTQPAISLLIAGIEATLLLIFGYWLFKRVEFQFADIV